VPPPPPDVLDQQKPSPMQSAVRVVLSLLLLYLIFGVLIPSFADYDQVWDAITSLTVGEVVLLSALTVVVELGKAGPYAILLDGIGAGKAFVTQESAAVVSNTVPGPSGTATKYVTYRRFGVGNEDFGRAVAVNSAWSNVVPLVLPAVAVVMLATQESVPGKVWLLVLAALALSLVAIWLVVRIVRSETFAYRLGERVGRVYNWARGVAHRPPAGDMAQAVVDFRGQVQDDAHRHWAGLTGVVVMKEVATATVLLVSLRSLGATRGELSAVAVLAVYTVVRLLTLVEITPGNIGIAETLYISALMWAGGDAVDEDVVVAAVFTFRMFTYLGPILVGGACWFWLSRYFRSHDRTPVPEPSP
jgi:putative heme transporter